MRLMFWKKSDKAGVSPAQPVAAPANAAPVAPPMRPAAPAAVVVEPAGTLGDLDLRLVWQALLRNKAWIIVPTAVAAALSFAVVNLITPRYKSEARILV